MRVHQRLPLSPRPAFTLVELIVVIGIIAGLAALTVLIFPRLQESQRVNKGADVLQGQLFLARQMALRDQLPRGVRLMQNSSGLVTSLQIIEQPLPLNPGQVTISGTTATFTGTAPAAGTVLAGDFLDLSAAGDSYTTVSPHAMHLITGPPTASGTGWQVSLKSTPNITSASLCRIVRSARPAVGINPVALPADVAVDALYTTPLVSPIPPSTIRSIIPIDAATGFADVLFDPSGKVLSTAGANGKVILYVYDPTKVAPEEALVGVFTRTGSIVAQPVAPGADPYAFIKDGTTSGM